MALPVFAARTHNSVGCGEFLDLLPLVEFADAAGMRLIQVLGVFFSFSTAAAAVLSCTGAAVVICLSCTMAAAALTAIQGVYRGVPVSCSSSNSSRCSNLKVFCAALWL